MFAAPIMLLLDTNFVLDHARLRSAVADIGDKGFDTVCLEFRNSMYDEYDPQGKAAMRIVAEETQRLGLLFVKIMPMPGSNIVSKHPEARQVWAVEQKAIVSDGRFSLALRSPGAAAFSPTEPVFAGIAKAFAIERDERSAIVRADDVTERIVYTVDTHSVLTVTGTCDADGELLVYAAYAVDCLDFAFPRFCSAVDSYLEQYEDLPLDGYAIDEFGAGNRSADSYMIGSHFLREFKGKNGYELTDKLYLLKHEAAGECAGRTRYDYYRLTLDQTYRIQKYVKDSYTRRYGGELFGGFHSTWWGESNSGDLWAGNIDYFRLTDNLSGGFVDAQFDAERTMTSMTLLAESLAKYSETGVAYNMCWDRDTTLEKLDVYQRLLAVRNVRWVGHAYGSPGPFGPGYPDHSTWAHTRLCVTREKRFQALFGGAVTRPKVAMMYVWESAACLNDDYMHYHRLSMKALLDKLLHRHIEVDVVPTFETDLTRYEALIVLWPTMLPEAAWQAIERFAAFGGRLVFIGPPARCTTEGRDLRGEFAQLTGARSAEATSGKPYDGEYEYEARDLWFASGSIPMRCYPLQLADGTAGLRHGGELLGVCKRNVEYYAFELPLTPYFAALLDELAEIDGGPALPAGIYAKTAYEGEDTVIALAAAAWDGRINDRLCFRRRRSRSRMPRWRPSG